MDELESAIGIKDKKIKDLVHLFFALFPFPELFFPALFIYFY